MINNFGYLFFSETHISAVLAHTHHYYVLPWFPANVPLGYVSWWEMSACTLLGPEVLSQSLQQFPSSSCSSLNNNFTEYSPWGNVTSCQHKQCLPPMNKAGYRAGSIHQKYTFDLHIWCGLVAINFTLIPQWLFTSTAVWLTVNQWIILKNKTKRNI